MLVTGARVLRVGGYRQMRAARGAELMARAVHPASGGLKAALGGAGSVCSATLCSELHKKPVS